MCYLSSREAVTGSHDQGCDSNESNESQVPFPASFVTLGYYFTFLSDSFPWGERCNHLSLHGCHMLVLGRLVGFSASPTGLCEDWVMYYFIANACQMHSI